VNAFDYLLIGVVLLSVVLAVWRGFVYELLAILGMVTAFFLASRFSAEAGAKLSGWIDQPQLQKVLGFVAIFLAIVIFFALLGLLLRKLLKSVKLSMIDRVLGFFFGLARGVLLIAIGFLLYSNYSKPQGQVWYEQSLFAPYVADLSHLLAYTIPAGYPFSLQTPAPTMPSEPPADDTSPAKETTL